MFWGADLIPQPQLWYCTAEPHLQPGIADEIPLQFYMKIPAWLPISMDSEQIPQLTRASSIPVKQGTIAILSGKLLKAVGNALCRLLGTL